MWPNPQFPADLVIITEEIFNEKLHFLCSGGSTIAEKSKMGLFDAMHYFFYKNQENWSEAECSYFAIVSQPSDSYLKYFIWSCYHIPNRVYSFHPRPEVCLLKLRDGKPIANVSNEGKLHF